MNEKSDDYQEDEEEPMLPLDERFRRSKQYELDLEPEDDTEKEQSKLRRLIRLLYS